MSDPAPRLADRGICPICERGELGVPRYRKGGHDILRCPRCGLLFISPLPDPSRLREIYDASYFLRGNKYPVDPSRQHGGGQQDTDLARATFVKRHCRSGRLLDVGCALGGFLCAAREEGFQVSGVEVSPYAAQYAREVHHLPVCHGDICNLEMERASYDVVTMWDVVEHLLDPFLTLKKINRILRPGGLLFISTGDAESYWARLTGKTWPLLTPPQHLYFFGEKSLTKALSKSHFSVCNKSYKGKFVRFDFLLFKASESFGNIVKPFHFFMNLLRLNQKKIYINLFDILTVVSVKQ